MKYVLLLLSCLFLIYTDCSASEDCSESDTDCTITCDNDNDQTDFTQAISDVAAGAVIHIAAGSCAIASTITINKALTLNGAGYSSTTLTGAAGITMIIIAPGAAAAIDVSGFHSYFAGASGSHMTITGSSNGSYELNQITIHDSKFTNGSGITATGWVEGVIYDNIFANVEVVLRHNGDNAYIWVRDLSSGVASAGTANALFFEHNTVTLDADFPGAGNEHFYHQDGGKTVARYNTFDDSECLLNGTGYTMYDAHGFFAPDHRGSTLNEFYNNAWIDSTRKYFKVRGGSHLIYNNAWTCSGDCWIGELKNEFVDTWPQIDNIYNTFLWNNTINGTQSYISVSDGYGDVVVLNQDYFNHAPASSGGKLTVNDTADITNPWDATFSAGVANAYYPYTPYTCPHPLATEYAGYTCDTATAGTGGYPGTLGGIESPRGINIQGGNKAATIGAGNKSMRIQ